VFGDAGVVQDHRKAVAAAARGRLLRPCCGTPKTALRHLSRLTLILKGRPTLAMERDMEFEPTTFILGRSGASVGRGTKALQVGDNLENRSEAGSHPVPPRSTD
jgi:hypothetical protein